MIKTILLKKLTANASKWVVLTIDTIIVAINFIVAYVMRFGITASFVDLNAFHQLPIVLILALSSFLFVGSYKGVIRQTGMKDAYNLFLSVTLFLALSSALVLVSRFYSHIVPEFLNIPLSIVDLHYLLNIIVLVTSRLAFKYCYHYIKYNQGKPKSKIMIYGAENYGVNTLTTLAEDREKQITVFGFIDHVGNKKGKTINGVKVYKVDQIDASFVAKHGIKEVIISVPSLDKKKLYKISENYLSLGLKIKIIPSYEDWNNGVLEASQIKPIEIEDLLERPSININNKRVEEEINNKTILITGAAGSIGSEIVRQLSVYNYHKLILVDQCESELYDIEQELHRKGVERFEAIIGDVREAQRMAVVFETYRPNVVFHAAAYKHVPLMERFPAEAVKVNVLGTKNIVQLSEKFGVNKFVFVSTDKAVNPTNVMGATKRAAEMLIQSFQRNSKTKFITTRFGNVLGSNGSVIPLFKKQIELGGPLTVTHEEVTRYFMTIPEASRLVVEAATMGQGGEVFIFDMGDSVKILDLAKKMIKLSGFKYPEEIDIKITGLRSGEKLYEELLANTDNTMPTYNDKIMISKCDADLSFDVIRDKIEDLCIMDLLNQDTQIVTKLKEIVPEYISKNSVFEKIDK